MPSNLLSVEAFCSESSHSKGGEGGLPGSPLRKAKLGDKAERGQNLSWLPLSHSLMLCKYSITIFIQSPRTYLLSTCYIQTELG